MFYVLIRAYSRFGDIVTGVQFDPVMDAENGSFVAVAEVDEETAETYRARAAFEVLDQAGYDALIGKTQESDLVESETGDPLADQGKAKPAAKDDAPKQGDPLGSAPPPPPSSK